MTTQYTAAAPASGTPTHATIVDDTLPDHEIQLAVDVSLDGHFAPDVPEYAKRKIRAAAKHCSGPILRASVRLIRYSDPALPRPVVSRATLNVNGRMVRVQTAAASARAGLDALQESLHNALGHLDRQPRHPHRSTSDHVGAVREIRPQGAIAGACTVDEAIGTLDSLDRDFQLFHDVDTDQDTLLFRAGPTGYRLAQANHRPRYHQPATPVSVELSDAPRLTPEQAAEHLECDGRPYLFFVDLETGRGRALHVRHDGHYGLVKLS